MLAVQKSKDCKKDVVRKRPLLTWADICRSSLGWVWIQPRGSRSARYSCSGRAVGRLIAWWVPCWGTITIDLISFTCTGSSPVKHYHDKINQSLHFSVRA